MTTTQEKLEKSLRRLKAMPPADAPMPKEKVHPNLLLVVQSGLTSDQAFEASYRHHTFDDIFLSFGGTSVCADGRAWTQVFALKDPHRRLGVFELEEEDPMLWVADMEEDWDSHRNAPTRATPVCSLATLVTSFKRMKAAKVAEKLTFAPLEWTAPTPHAHLSEAWASGPAVLSRGRAEDGTCDLAMLASDGSVTSVRCAGILMGSTWAGPDTVATLGNASNALVAVQVHQRDASGAWATETLWSGPGGGRPMLKMAGTDGAFAFLTRSGPNTTEFTIHAWRRSASGWKEAQVPVSVHQPQNLRLTDADHLWYDTPAGNQEVVLSDAGATAGQLTPATYASLFDGDASLLSRQERGVIEVTVGGQKVAELKLGPHHSAVYAVHRGHLLALVMPKKGCAKLLGWRRKGAGYAPWFERDTDIKDSRDFPQAIGTTGEAVFVVPYGKTVWARLPA